MFLASSGFQFVLTIGGVLIFAGLTAWDTQKLKSMYSSAHSVEEARSSPSTVRSTSISTSSTCS